MGDICDNFLTNELDANNEEEKQVSETYRIAMAIYKKSKVEREQGDNERRKRGWRKEKRWKAMAGTRVSFAIES